VVTIRSVEGQEMLDIFHRLDSYAFRPTPPLPERTEWEARRLARQGPQYYAVFEGDEGVAVAVCPLMTQNVRGAMLKMAGYASISTDPKYRRKGYVRDLLRYCHELHREEGRVVSCLYPFRESFYERLGYVAFPQQWQAVFKADCLLPLLRTDLPGEVELSMTGEGYEVYRQFVLEMQTDIHGMAVFEHSLEAAWRENRSWMLKVKVDGRVDGIMLYAITGNQMMNYNLQATRFFYRTSHAKYVLLEWLARHVDQAGNARVWVRPDEQPNTWISDMRPAMEPAFVAPMGRVLDVAGIGGLDVGEGAFTAEITDPDCPWNNGLWSFEGAGGKLKVSPWLASADCRLTIQGLSALVYGVGDPGDFPFRGWGNPSPELAEVMRAMFPPELPYLHEQF